MKSLSWKIIGYMWEKGVGPLRRAAVAIESFGCRVTRLCRREACQAFGANLNKSIWFRAQKHVLGLTSARCAYISGWAPFDA